MVFMNADNDLEPYALFNTETIEYVGSTPAVNFLVQIDRSERYDSSHGDWTEARRFRLVHDEDAASIASPVLENLGEISMDDPAVLSDFLVWSIENYPARHYALIMWNHGAGWSGMSNDDSSPDVYDISVDDFADTLSATRSTLGIGPFDIIGFDMCLMGMLEVDAAIREEALYRIGSQENEPGFGWDYESFAALLTTTPGISARDLAIQTVDSYATYYTTPPFPFIPTDPNFTMSAIDLSTIGVVEIALNDMASSLIRDLSSTWIPVGRAGYFADSYSRQPRLDAVNDSSYVDIVNMIDILDHLVPEESITSDISTLRSAVESSVVHYRSGIRHEHSHGISVFFPATLEFDELPAYRLTSFGSGSWGNLIESYQSQLLTLSDPSMSSLIADPPVIERDSTAAINGVVTGNGLLVGSVAMMERVSGGMRSLSSEEANMPPVVLPDGTEVPIWIDGENPFHIGLDDNVMSVSDGVSTNRFSGVLYQLSDGSYEATGIARYYRAADGESELSRLFFGIDSDTRTGNLRAVAFNSIYGTNRVTTPKTGDSFELEYMFFPEGSSVSEYNYGDEMRISCSPDGLANNITISFADLPYGEYLVGVFVYNLAGEFGFNYVDLSISNCGDIGLLGCCDGDTLRYCLENELLSVGCGDDPVCGWDDGLYGCGTSGDEDPLGAFPLHCPGTYEYACDDGLDEDGDGSIDCYDTDCLTSGVCSNACSGLDYIGCCSGEVLYWCEEGTLQASDCSGSPSCGWVNEEIGYNCGATGDADPTGSYPADCPPSVEVNCDDGVDNDENGLVDCYDGDCSIFSEECPCGRITAEGCCLGGTLYWCMDFELQTLECGDLLFCGWSADLGFYSCSTDGEEEPSGEHPMLCMW